MNKVVFLFIIALCMSACKEKADIRITDLSCEMLDNPQGMDLVSPRLSWKLTSGSRHILQTGYQILVASSLDKLNDNTGDIWDSGPVESEKSVLVSYGGKPLESRKTYYWKVKVKTGKGETQWSQPATWSMAFMDPNDWKARWTGLDKSFSDDKLEGKTRLAARYFRKEFKTDQNDITKATLYVSGLGLYQTVINGKRVGDQVLAPTLTFYTNNIKYNTHNVTDMLSEGENTIAIVLGNGRFFNLRTGHEKTRFQNHFGFPKMLLQLEIDYADGSRQTVISDNSWKVTAEGPIIANSEYDGEEYDARKELTGWDCPGYDDSQWMQAELVEAPGGVLEAQLNKNIRVMETVKPVGITQTVPGTYILDMGQNMVGWLRMNVSGKKGDRVKLRFAETVRDGAIYTDNLLGALVTDVYTLKGDQQEVWEPTFTYHGFRYVEITGFPGVPTIEHFEGQVIYDEMPVTGHFETSDATINRVYKNACWGIKGNYRGMPTDCPQRAERMGWLGDRAANSHGESFVFGIHGLYAKWLDDIAYAQNDEGSIPNVVPMYWPHYFDNITWPGAYLMIVDMMYKQFGDEQIIGRHYDKMKKWLDHMKDRYMEDYIITKDRYGDWCMPPESPELIHSEDPARKTDGPLLSTAYYFYFMELMAGYAHKLEKQEDEKYFSEQAVHVKEAFNRNFFNTVSKQYGNNTVTANLLPLYFGIVPDEYRQHVLQHIVDKTMGEFDGHVSTGLVGIQWLMRGLSDFGKPDLAFKIATNRDYPSWGYMIEKGATTIWELWNGDTADPRMNSHNHVMLLGDLIIWYYEYLAGIRNDSGSFGFRNVIMKPYTNIGPDYVNASYESVRGLIKSDWKRGEDDFIWNITIPCNSTATVYIPAINEDKVLEGDKKASDSEGVRFLEMDGEYAVFKVGSGNYRFMVQN
jgi:alpha-L-rhamnosidase